MPIDRPGVETVPSARHVVWLAVVAAGTTLTLAIIASPWGNRAGSGATIRMCLMLLLGTLPYWIALVASRFSVPRRRWAVLVIVLYGGWNLTLAVQRLRFPDALDFTLAIATLPIFFAPVAFLLAALGSAAWTGAGRRGLVGSVATLSAFSVFGYLLLFSGNPQAQIQSILKTREWPSSAHNLQCEDTGWTDTIVTCYVEIAPDDFHLLLVGWPFARGPAAFRTHTRWRDLGYEFEAVAEYKVYPKEFVHGGWVKVFADAERRRAIIDYYVE